MMQPARRLKYRRQKPNWSCIGIGRRFVRKNANNPHDMASIRDIYASVVCSLMP